MAPVGDHGPQWRAHRGIFVIFAGVVVLMIGASFCVMLAFQGLGPGYDTAVVLAIEAPEGADVARARDGVHDALQARLEAWKGRRGGGVDPDPDHADRLRAEIFCGTLERARFVRVVSATGHLEIRFQGAEGADPPPVYDRERFGSIQLQGGGGIEIDETAPGGSTEETTRIVLALKPLFREEFEKLTGDRVGQTIAVVVDGEVIAEPVLREAISGFMVLDAPTTWEPEDLVAVLARPLDVPVRVVEVTDADGEPIGDGD